MDKNIKELCNKFSKNLTAFNHAETELLSNIADLWKVLPNDVRIVTKDSGLYDSDEEEIVAVFKEGDSVYYETEQGFDNIQTLPTSTYILIAEKVKKWLWYIDTWFNSLSC